MSKTLKDAVAYFDSIGVEVVDASFFGNTFTVSRFLKGLPDTLKDKYTAQVMQDEGDSKEDFHGVAFELQYTEKDNGPVVSLMAHLRHRDGERFSGKQTMFEEAALPYRKPSFIVVAGPDARKLPFHPDSTPRESDEVSKAVSDAVDKGEASLLGVCGNPSEGAWYVVQWGGRYFIFLSSIGDWCWEVSEEGARFYAASDSDD